MARDYFIPVRFDGDPADTSNPTPEYFRVVQREDLLEPFGEFEIPSFAALGPELVYELPASDYVWRDQDQDGKPDLWNPLFELRRPVTLEMERWKRFTVWAELGGAGNTGGGDDDSGPSDKADNIVFPNWVKIGEAPVWALAGSLPALIDGAKTGHADRYAQKVCARTVLTAPSLVTAAAAPATDWRLLHAVPAFALLRANEAANSQSFAFTNLSNANRTLAQLGIEEGDELVVAKNEDNSGQGSTAYEIIRTTQYPRNAQGALTAPNDAPVARSQHGTSAQAFTDGDLVGRYTPGAITHLALTGSSEDTRPISRLRIYLGA